MSKRRAGRGFKYTDDFKRRLVAESQGDGVSVPMVSRRHDVPTRRIYAWRGDARRCCMDRPWLICEEFDNRLGPL